jgi:hypothetical protein
LLLVLVVLQEMICSCGDIVPATDDDPWRPPNEHAMFRTINALLMHQLKLKMHDGGLDATNTNATDDDDDDGFVDHESVTLRGIRRAPDSLDFNRKRKFVSVKFQLPEKEEVPLNEIIEECEYDSDIGKFKCDAVDQDESEENSSTSSMVDHYLEVEHMNDLNSPLKCVNKNGLDRNNIQEVTDDDSHYKIVMKRIEFFETNRANGKIENQEISTVDVVDGPKEVAAEPTEADKTLSTILFAIFILTVALLIIFPLPN